MEYKSIGIDISKGALDVYCSHTKRFWRVANAPEPIASLAQELSQVNPDFIVFEPSGGYERLLMAALACEGLRFSRVNARQVRDYP